MQTDPVPVPGYNTAPYIPIPGYETGYPSPKRRIGKAWSIAWDELNRAWPEPVDGTELAQRVADISGLEKSTLLTLLTRAATAGLLEREQRKVEGTRGIRARTHYRLPSKS